MVKVSGYLRDLIGTKLTVFYVLWMRVSGIFWISFKFSSYSFELYVWPILVVFWPSLGIEEWYSILQAYFVVFAWGTYRVNFWPLLFNIWQVQRIRGGSREDNASGPLMTQNGGHPKCRSHRSPPRLELLILAPYRIGTTNTGPGIR